MKTFHWEQVDRKDGLVELHCFHTQRNKNFNKTRRIMSAFYALSEDVEKAKKSFEKNRRCVVDGGAWETIKDAVWSFIDGEWVIDSSQIKICE